MILQVWRLDKNQDADTAAFLWRLCGKIFFLTFPASRQVAFILRIFVPSSIFKSFFLPLFHFSHLCSGHQSHTDTPTSSYCNYTGSIHWDSPAQSYNLLMLNLNMPMEFFCQVRKDTGYEG